MKYTIIFQRTTTEEFEMEMEADNICAALDDARTEVQSKMEAASGYYGTENGKIVFNVKSVIEKGNQ